MTRKDAILIQLNFLNIVIGTVTLGAMVALGIYNVQSSGINVIAVIGEVLILGVVAKILVKKYEELLHELEGL